MKIETLNDFQGPNIDGIWVPIAKLLFQEFGNKPQETHLGESPFSTNWVKTKSFAKNRRPFFFLLPYPQKTRKHSKRQEF